MNVVHILGWSGQIQEDFCVPLMWLPRPYELISETEYPQGFTNIIFRIETHKSRVSQSEGRGHLGQTSRLLLSLSTGRKKEENVDRFT